MEVTSISTSLLLDSIEDSVQLQEAYETAEPLV